MSELSFNYSGKLIIAPIIKVSDVQSYYTKDGGFSTDLEFEYAKYTEGLAIEYVENDFLGNLVVAFIRPSNTLEVVDQERLAKVINNGLEAEFLRLVAFAMTEVTCAQEFDKAKQASNKSKYSRKE